MKKKLFFTIVTFFIIILISTSDVKAIDYCTPDCPETPWIGDTLWFFDFTVDTCVFTAVYTMRKACDTWCDIFIELIYTQNPNCTGYSFNYLLDIAAQKILYYEVTSGEFASIFGSDCGPHVIGDCSDYWRVVKFKCWSTIPPGQNPPYTIAIPCEIYCCVTNYQVCLTRNGYTVTKIHTSSDPGDCGHHDPTCHDSCY